MLAAIDKANGFVFVHRVARTLHAEQEAGRVRAADPDALGAAALRALAGTVAAADVRSAEFLHDVAERYTA